VYDITPYLEFHPGGRVQLLRAAGKDGTHLFETEHPWVNLDFLMEKHVVGTFTTSSESGHHGRSSLSVASSKKDDFLKAP